MKTQPIILLVEDDPYFAESIICVLKKGGMSPLISSTLSEAKRTVGRHHPDLVIIDIMLPPGQGEDPLPVRGGFTSGLVLAEWLNAEYPDISFIGYSAVRNPEFIQHFER